MKKIVIFILAVFLTAGAVSAQVPGLYAGGEGTVEDFSNFGDTLYFRGYAGIDTDELAENWDVYAEAGIEAGFKDFWMITDIDIEVGYHTLQSSSSELVLLLGSYTHINLKPSFGFDYSDLSPGVRFTKFIDLGCVYARADLPFQVIDEFFGFVDLNFWLGVETDTGLEAYIKVFNTLKNGNNEADFFNGLEFFGSVEADRLYAEITIDIPFGKDAIKYGGIYVRPEVYYEVKEGMQAYFKVPISGLGSKTIDEDGGEVSGATIGLTLGVKFSF